MKEPPLFFKSYHHHYFIASYFQRISAQIYVWVRVKDLKAYFKQHLLLLRTRVFYQWTGLKESSNCFGLLKPPRASSDIFKDEFQFFCDHLLLNAKLRRVDYIKLTMKNCDKCFRLEKKYRVLEAELAFQLKKLQEDMAHQKITLHLAHQRQIQKLNEKVTSQRHDKDGENKKWIDKYDSMARDYEAKLEKKDLEWMQKIRRIELELEQRQKMTQNEKQAKIREEIELMRGEGENQKRRLLHVKEQQKRLMQKFHRQEVERSAERLRREVELAEEQKSKLKQQIRQLQKKDIMNRTIEIQLSEEMFYKKEENSSLKDKIGQLEQTLKLCHGELHTKERVLEYVRKEYNDRLSKLQREFEQQKQELANNNRREIEVILNKQLKRCESYQTKIKQIDQKRQKQIKIYQANFEQVRTLVDENRCPPKFSTQISHLKYKLTSKEKEVQRVKAEVKLCQLEMDNNDQILTKFFLNPSLGTTPELTHKRSKDYKIKNTRGSITGSTGANWRSGSSNKERCTQNDTFNEYHTTSLQNLECGGMKQSRTIKLL